jgi:hypothetical protein
MWSSGWYWENYVRLLGSKGYRCVTPTLLYHDISFHEDPDPRLGSTSVLDYASRLGKDRSVYLPLVERQYLTIIQGETFPARLFCSAGFFSGPFPMSLWSETIPGSGQASLETSEKGP